MLKVKKTNDVEYVFWLRNWRDQSISFWPKVGQFKCVVTTRKISVTSIDNDPDNELSIDIALILECEVFPNSQYSNQNVRISLYDRKITLYPVTPFDPNLALVGNHVEAQTLSNIINVLRSGSGTPVIPNPYIRQLAMINNIERFGAASQFMKAELVRFEKLNRDWDAHTSPWVYSDLYGDKLIYLKTLGRIFAYNILLAIVGTAVLLLIVYLLALLHVI